MGGKGLVFCLVLAELFLLRAMAERSDQRPYPSPILRLRLRALMVELQPNSQMTVSGAGTDAPSSSESENVKESGAAEAPDNRSMVKHQSSDNSAIGGGVIIGGLVAAIFAAVFCYIRVTRRREADKH